MNALNHSETKKKKEKKLKRNLKHRNQYEKRAKSRPFVEEPMRDNKIYQNSTYKYSYYHT